MKELISDFEFSPENKTGEPSLESQKFAAVLNSSTVLFILCLALSCSESLHCCRCSLSTYMFTAWRSLLLEAVKSFWEIQDMAN